VFGAALHVFFLLVGSSLRRAILHLLLLRGELLFRCLGGPFRLLVALFGGGLRERRRERRGYQRGCHRRRQDMLEHGELLHWDGRPRCTRVAV